MVTIVKHEWHQVDSQFAFELDETILSEIYPDLDEDEIVEKLRQIENGEISVDEIVDDAYEEGVDIDWDRQYDDWWTDRKGGYDVTYELGDEDSWHHEPEPDPPYHKCTKCRWEGSKWESKTAYVREDGSIIPDEVDEEHHHTNEVCPMCDSDLKLTEFGEKKFKEDEERRAHWAQEEAEEEIEESYHAECTVCDWTGPESDTQTIEGQMCCPECREPVYTAEQVAENSEIDMEQALEELKLEFENLLQAEEKPAVQPMKCTFCEWHGDWTDTDNNKEGEDICPECKSPVVDVE